MKRTIILSESERHRVIEECVNEILEEGMFKNAMMGLAVGAASMFPSQGNAQQSHIIIGHQNQLDAMMRKIKMCANKYIIP